MDDKRPVPLSALRFTIGDFELGDNGEDAKTAPFRMVARSGNPIDHWYWGRIVHDLSGVQHKGRIPIDYAHDDKEIIGYGNKFDVDGDGLHVSGALVPYKDNDRASEVVHKFKAGVPYEASINFGGDGIQVENVPDGESVEVNGFEFAGPGVVVRQWPLRGVAVCPYGADGNTSSEFSTDEKVNVEFFDMSSEKPELKEELEAEVTNETENVEGQPVDEITEEAEPVAEVQTEEVEEAVEPVAALSQEPEVPEGQRFLDAFGVDGGVWFAQGLSFDEARQNFMDKILKENEELRAKLASVPAGEVEPVSFSESQRSRKSLVPFSGKG